MNCCACAGGDTLRIVFGTRLDAAACENAVLKLEHSLGIPVGTALFHQVDLDESTGMLTVLVSYADVQAEKRMLVVGNYGQNIDLEQQAAPGKQPVAAQRVEVFLTSDWSIVRAPGGSVVHVRHAPDDNSCMLSKRMDEKCLLI